MSQLFQPILPSNSLYNAEKRAAPEIRLGPDPQQWPAQIFQSAMEAHPELSAYQVDVTMEAMDPESSVAKGAVEIRLKQAPSLDAMGQARNQSGNNKVARIPVLIQEGRMKPLDLIVLPDTDMKQAKVLPLTPRRLRQAMFRDDIFDGTSTAPGTTSIAGFMYPPNRDSFYGGNDILGTKTSSLLADVAAESSELERKELMRKIARVEGFRYNKLASSALHTLLSPPPPSEKKAMESFAHELPPTVIQVLSLGEGSYLYKSASAEAWLPQEKVLTRAELFKIASPELMEAVDTTGGITLSDNDLTAEQMGPQPEQINRSCVARVFTSDGQELIGVVLVHLLDTQGQLLPLALFTNGTVHAFQGEVWGVPLSQDLPSLPSRPVADGYGVFYEHGSFGRLNATVPMTIQTRLNDVSGRTTYVGVLDDGSPVQVRIEPGLRKPVNIDGVMLLPEGYLWLPLDRSKSVVLQNSPGQTPEQRKVAQEHTVSIRAFGDHFSLRGGPLQKIASQTHSLPMEEAMFYLAGLGVPAQEAITKLAEASHLQSEAKSASVEVPYVLRTLEERGAEFRSKLAQPVAARPLPPIDLVKEAAFIPDPMSIDTMLGLSLLTPDNIALFTSRIPDLERTQQNLCEMLIASRLGLRDIPEPALEKAIQALELVIEGVFQLRFQEADVAS